jgi:ankyrin repeat protein
MAEEYLRIILKFAEIDGNYGPIEILLSNSSIKTEQIQTDLLPAAMRGYEELAKALLLYGISLSSPDVTALHWAARFNGLQAIGTLLSSGSVTEAVDEFGMTALHYAAEAGSAAALGLLLDEGKRNVDMVDKVGRTALHYAAREGHAEGLDLLLKSKASPRIKDMNFGMALDYVFSLGHYSLDASQIEHVVKAFVQAGAPVNQDTYGRTALHIAAMNRFNDVHPEYIRSYVVGIDLETRDKNGETALHYAVGTQLWNVVRMLLELGANLGISNENGVTPLKMIEILAGYDVDDAKSVLLDIASRKIGPRV